MTFDEAWEIIPGNGWLHKEEGQLLWNVVQSCRGDILEVGCYQGKSSCLMALAAGVQRQIHSVDPFEGFDSDDMTGDKTLDAWIQNTGARSEYCNIRLWATKVELWKPLPCGFAYLDGDHTYQGTVNQIRKARETGCKEVCIHDYAQTGDGRAIVAAIHDERLNVVQVVDRMAHGRLEQR